jgi:O-antigen/teichoic acid export membrane protein
MKVLLASLIVGLLVLAFVGALALWARWSRGRDANAVQLVAKNSGFLLLSQFANKGLDFLFALYMLRALGPTGNGQYQFAILVWLYLKTVTDFGMGVLATQQIAHAPQRAGALLGQTTLLRLLLLALSLPPLAAFLIANARWGGIGPVQIGAVVLLALSVVPTAYTDAATSVFNGRERFEIPAAVTILGSLVGLGLRAGALLVGWGPVGLAVAAVVANLLTLGPIILLIRRLGVRAEWSLPWGAARGLLRDGGPLLVNALLQSLFFTLDVFILQPLKGETAVGLYGVGIKLINTLLIISSTFTLVLFPQLARQAVRDRALLARTYHFAVRLLLVLALPLAVGSAVLAPELVRVVGGKAYLPGAATALRLIVWLLPFSFVNGVTQYVLIALGQQRRMTWAFVATVVFNIVANLLFIPRYSYAASAVISVLSEIVLFVPFALWTRDALGPLPLLRLAWQPVVAAALFALVAWGVGWRAGLGAWPGALLGGAVYCLALLALGTVGAEERAFARRLVQRGSGPNPPAPFPTGEGGAIR